MVLALGPQQQCCEEVYIFYHVREVVIIIIIIPDLYSALFMKFKSALQNLRIHIVTQNNINHLA